MLKIVLSLLVGMVIFVGIPLLGWGINSAETFFENPARLLYVVIIIVLQLISVFFVQKKTNGGDNRKKETPRHKIDLILIQILSLAVVFIAPYSDRRATFILTSGDITRYIGLALMTAGFFLMHLAEKYLDKQFSVEVTLQENHQLITTGPYRYLRHPRYAGILLFFLGISLSFNSIPSLIVVLLLSTVLVWRVFAEEALLRREFGRQWDEYKSKTWRLIPFIF